MSTAGPEDTLSSGTTDLVAVAEETIRALKRLFAEKSFHLTAPEELRIPLSRAEQMEILGNLIENAGKWSMSEVSITLFDAAISKLMKDGNLAWNCCQRSQCIGNANGAFS